MHHVSLYNRKNGSKASLYTHMFFQSNSFNSGKDLLSTTIQIPGFFRSDNVVDICPE
jgi:hypothetical protein